MLQCPQRMSFSSGSSSGTSSSRSRRRRSGWNLRLTPGGIVILLLLNFVILALIAFGLNRITSWFPGSAKGNELSPSTAPPTETTSKETQAGTNTLTPTPLGIVVVSPSPEKRQSTPTQSQTPPATLNSAPSFSLSQNIILLALDEGSSSHLFAYQPQTDADNQPIRLTRLTNGPWQDIDPTISPDGTRVAFASTRNGYWDIYLLEISSGLVTRVTDSLEYDGSPSWSPDGRWLVYETYIDDNLELMIHPLLEETGPLRLTHNPAADYHPTWSPQGRQVAFVSNRSGESEIWVADLDLAEDDRFQNISRNPSGNDDRPAWSPDGGSIVWSGMHEGIHNIYLQQVSKASNALPSWLAPSRDYLGGGDWPVWNSDGSAVLTIVTTPNQTYLTAYPVPSSGLVLPPLILPGPVSGLTSGDVALSLPIREPYRQAALETPTPLWETALTSAPESTDERFQLVNLEGVEAPQPKLHDAVDESFQALRQRVAEDIGWDFLSTLENAFVPLTSPMSPGMGDDWLYTGRAFAFTTLPLNAGWIAVVREDFGSQTYWRIYLRARYQDGSVGFPLHQQPWNFNTRYSGDTSAYEQGGQLAETIPPGYWLDFTSLALSYGWERLPALSTWRSAYPAARFNEFAMTQGLSWRQAMLQLYPPEILITPTAVVPPTRTPSPTPRWYQSPTPSYTPTPRPTFTPVSPTPSHTSPPPSTTPTSTATPGLETDTPSASSSPTFSPGLQTGTPTP